MIDALTILLAQTGPPSSPSTIPIARGWFMLLGLAIAAIVLVAGLLVLTSLRRMGRAKPPGKTPYIDAWAEAGRRAKPEPSASDILGDEDNAYDGEDNDDFR